VPGNSLDRFFSVTGPACYQYQLKCELNEGTSLKKLVIVNDVPAEAKPAGEALQLENGEIWAGQVTSLGAGRVTVESPLLGQREVDLASVRSIDFMPGLPAPGPEKDGVLHRLKGSPVRGEPVSLDAQRLTVQTALGAVPLERKAVKQYVFGGAKRKAAGAGDEVTLVDGGVLLGQVWPAKEGLTLKHATLGELAIPANQWRSARRRPAHVTYLVEKTPTKLETFPLIRKPANPPQVDRPRGANPGDSAATYVCRMHVWPRTIVGYPLEGQGGQKVLFRAAVGLLAGSRGAASVRFRAGEKTVFETVLTPKDPKATEVTFQAEAGDLLNLEVDFDKTIRFPCSVTVDDPLVLRK
jgi:hypothetical protein